MSAIRKRSWKNADGVMSTRWFLDIRDGNGNRDRRQFESRKEAEAFRIATESQMRAGTFRGDAAKFTVKDAADRYLVYAEGRRQRGERMTRQNYNTMEGHIRNYICRDPKGHEGKIKPSRLKAFDGGIGSIKLAQLTSRAVGDFRDSLRDAGVTVVTTRKILKKGRLATMTHDYKRNGTTTLFAALNVLDGSIIGRCMQRHRHREFIGFLDAVEAEVPAGKRIEVILDNYAVHEHAEVRAWLDRHPRWTFHFTPTSASWANAVEGFFAKLTKRRLKRGVFRAIAELEAAIDRFLEATNQAPRPFRWKADPDKIIAAVKRGHQMLDSIH